MLHIQVQCFLDESFSSSSSKRLTWCERLVRTCVVDGVGIFTFLCVVIIDGQHFDANFGIGSFEVWNISRLDWKCQTVDVDESV